MSSSYIIELKRGLRANLPATDTHPGQPYFCTDTNQLFIWNGSAMVEVAGGAVAFNTLTSGTNTSADMKVGPGSTIESTGGVINATEINGVPITGTLTHAGQIPISQPGNASAVWADPLVQGLQAEGTSTSTVNPVLIAGKDASGNLKDISLDSSGNPSVNVVWGGTSVEAAQTSSTAGTGANPVVRNIPRRFGQILSTTPLAGNATFTSAWFDTNQTGDIYVEATVRSDQNGAGTALIIEHTDDTANGNFTATVASSQAFANSSASTSGTVQRRFWRVRYVNGATPQTSFELTASSYFGFPFQTGAQGSSNSGAILVQENFSQPNQADGVSNNSPVPVAIATGSSFGALFSPVYPYVFNGATWDRPRTPNVFKTVTATASGNTALWTPTVGKKFRLMRLLIQVTADAKAAAAADLAITFQDGASVLGVGESTFIGTAGATTTSSGNICEAGWLDLGNGILSAAANNVLNVNLSFALTGGVVRVTVCGTEE